MKKTILAIAVVLMAAAVGIAAADSGSVDVGGTVTNVPPVVGPINIDSDVLDDGTIPLNPSTGATFEVSATVTDMNGPNTLTNVHCIIKNSLTLVVFEGSMAVTPVDATSGEATILATIDGAVPAGIYTVYVTATDTGLEDGEATTTIELTVYEDGKFTITPLEMNGLGFDVSSSHSFMVVMNYGAEGEVFNVDSVEFGDLTVTNGVNGVTSTIPSGNIVINGELPTMTEIGQTATVQLLITIPPGTTDGDISGTGTLTLSTY